MKKIFEWGDLLWLSYPASMALAWLLLAVGLGVDPLVVLNPEGPPFFRILCGGLLGLGVLAAMLAAYTSWSDRLRR